MIRIRSGIHSPNSQLARLLAPAACTAAAALSLLLSAGQTATAQAQSVGEASAVVTALAKGTDAPPVSAQEIQVSVDGKQTEPSLWRAYGHRPVQLVLLIDGSARTSLGRNLDDMARFLSNQPPNISLGVAYMQNGQAVFAGPLSNDHAAVAKQLHLPAGSPGSSASPYFCLSQLARNWPAPRGDARREVVMVTDGVDPYNLRYDPDDPYVQTAIGDAQRAGLVVYSIYYRNQGRLSGSFYETNAGQNYLNALADETGGNLYYEGLGNPISLAPFFEDLNRRLGSQYELDVPVKLPAKQEKRAPLVALKVKSEVNNLKIRAPEHVAVDAAQ